jgi:hypothetical protein
MPTTGGLGGKAGAPPSRTQADPVQEAEAAVKSLRQAKDDESRRRATEALEKALEKLKHQPQGQQGNNKQ